MVIDDKRGAIFDIYLYKYKYLGQVANFSSGEDDTTFWSRLIQPDPTDMAQVLIGWQLHRAQNIIQLLLSIDLSE
jgi:hypothetical protein